MTQTCRDCGAAILKAISLRGKIQTLDARPNPQRGLYFLAAADGEKGTRMAIHSSHLDEDARDHALRQGLRLFTSHMATCRAKSKVRV